MPPVDRVGATTDQLDAARARWWSVPTRMEPEACLEELHDLIDAWQQAPATLLHLASRLRF